MDRNSVYIVVEQPCGPTYKDVRLTMFFTQEEATDYEYQQKIDYFGFDGCSRDEIDQKLDKMYSALSCDEDYMTIYTQKVDYPSQTVN